MGRIPHVSCRCCQFWGINDGQVLPRGGRSCHRPGFWPDYWACSIRGKNSHLGRFDMNILNARYIDAAQPVWVVLWELRRQPGRRTPSHTALEVSTSRPSPTGNCYSSSWAPSHPSLGFPFYPSARFTRESNIPQQMAAGRCGTANHPE